MFFLLYKKSMDKILELQNNVSRETFDKLKQYEALLKKWQKAINLVSKNTLKDIWNRHIIDSLQLIEHLPKDKNTCIIDLGSGAGFPALIIAMCGYKNVYAIESDERKCFFMKEVAKETNTKIEIINERIENVQNLQANVITARALAKIDELLLLSKNLTNRSTNYLFLKGKSWESELKKALTDFDFQAQSFQSLTDSEAKVVKISNLKSKN